MILSSITTQDQGGVSLSTSRSLMTTLHLLRCEPLCFRRKLNHKHYGPKGECPLKKAYNFGGPLNGVDISQKAQVARGSDTASRLLVSLRVPSSVHWEGLPEASQPTQSPAPAGPQPCASQSGAVFWERTAESTVR